MNENISRLMDGELSDDEFARCVAELKSDDAAHTWLCYHVIGDHLRGAGDSPRGAGGHSARFSANFRLALAAEPTVLAPVARVHVPAQPAKFAWAVAATLAAVTVVGWTAFSMVDAPPTAMAKAREAATVRAAQVKPPADLPADYLVAHQEFSPATAIQGGGSYLRSVATTPPESRP